MRCIPEFPAFVVFGLTALAAAGRAGFVLPADCDENGRVAVNELIVAVNISLGKRTLEACEAADVNGNGLVAINELIQGVNAALGQFPTLTPDVSPGTPTETPTITPEVTPSESPTPPSPTETATGVPSATPIAPVRPCGAEVLMIQDEISVTRSTEGVDAGNRVGGAPCGWGGGNTAKDRVFEYVAPDDGVFDVVVSSAALSPILTIRRNDCRDSNLLERLVEGTGESEAACDSDAAGQGVVELTVRLLKGERIAVIVDGLGDTSGSFDLDIRRRQPDLVVDSVIVASRADAGGLVEVSANLRNLGDGGAEGPWTLDFFLSRDPAGVDVVSIGPTSVEVEGDLAPGGMRTVTLPNGFSVPLVAAQDLFLVARVDSHDQIREGREDNNAKGSEVSVGASRGVILEQLVFRAGDGTIYQLLQAVPSLRATVEDSFRFTTLAVSLSTVTTCEVENKTPGNPLRAAVGTTLPMDLAQMRRTGILRPNSFAAPSFEASGSGRLILGGGLGATEICAALDRCGRSAGLVGLTEASQGVPPACIATAPSGSYCPGDNRAAKALAFGLPSNSGICSVSLPSQVRTESQVCASASTLTGGFSLRTGEAVVFVAEPGRAATGLAAGGFEVARASAGPCAAGQVAGPLALRAQQAHAPLLSQVQVQRNSQLREVTGSPDGRHVYVCGDGTLAAFARGADGRLTPVGGVQRQGVGGVTGLADGRSVTVSGDGRHVYVASGEGAVAVFQRDTQTGMLGFVEVQRDGVGGVDGLSGARSIAASGDGRQVYIVSAEDDAVAVFERDPGTGALSFSSMLRDEIEGVDGLARAVSVAVSDDNRHVYVASFDDDAVAVFERDAGTGRLQFIEAQRDGIGGVDGLFQARSVVVSADGHHVYVASVGDDALAVFERDRETGTLRFVEAERDGIGGVNGLDIANSVAVSGDGRYVYVASIGDDAVAVFERDPDAGTLAFVGLLRNGVSGVDGLNGARSVVVSADDRHVYVASGDDNAVAVFERDPAVGTLGFVAAQRAGVGSVSGLDGVRSVAVSGDGRHVYAASFDDDAVAVFGRDARTGALSFVEAERDGIAGVDGLNGARSIVLSEDDRNVYVASSVDDAVAVFERNPETGALDFIEAERDGVAGVVGLDGAWSIALSRNGRHAYVASVGDAVGENAVALFERDSDTGRLAFVGAQRDGVGGVDGVNLALSVALSGDDRHIYVVSQLDDAVAVFSRDAVAGVLAFVEIQRDGVDGVDGLDSARSAAVSGDGRNVYVVSSLDDAVAVFEREPERGTLRFMDVWRNGDGGVVGLDGAWAVSVSGEGRYVYVAGAVDDSLAVFERDWETGELSFVEVQRDGVAGVDGLDFPYSIAVSGDGRYVYVASTDDNAITVFRVN